MNVLVYTFSKYIIEKLYTSFIPEGISVYQLESAMNAENVIRDKKIDILLTDLTPNNSQDIKNLIHRVRNNSLPQVNQIAIIVYVEGVNKDLVMNVVNMGANGFFPISSPINQLINYLLMIYERTYQKPPKLHLERISLDSKSENQSLVVKFKSPVNEQTLMGVITQISASGMVIKLVGTFERSAVFKGMELSGLNFMLLGHEMNADGLIMGLQNDVCLIIFTNMSITDRNELSRFIFMKLSEMI